MSLGGLRNITLETAEAPGWLAGAYWEHFPTTNPQIKIWQGLANKYTLQTKHILQMDVVSGVRP